MRIHPAFPRCRRIGQSKAVRRVGYLRCSPERVFHSRASPERAPTRACARTDTREKLLRLYIEFVPHSSSPAPAPPASVQRRAHRPHRRCRFVLSASFVGLACVAPPHPRDSRRVSVPASSASIVRCSRGTRRFQCRRRRRRSGASLKSVVSRQCLAFGVLNRIFRYRCRPTPTPTC